ncbi:hypothetical protein Tco_0212991 [Tanacetum coccineum]
MLFLVFRLDARLHLGDLFLKQWESAGVDSSIFTKAWVDSAGSEGLKDHSAIDRWQSQTAAADSDFFNRLHVMDEEDSNINLKHQTGGVDNIKQSVVDYVVSLLMPLYKPRKFDKESHGADKAMAVFEFLDFKRKNKIRAFVDRLIERHMAMKTDTKSGGSYLLIHLSLSLNSDSSYASKDSQKETRDARDMLSVAI